MTAMGRVTVFLPAGAFLALGVMFLSSALVENEWFQWPILKRQGSRQRRIFIGVLALGFGFYNLYIWRSELLAEFLLNTLVLGFGFLIVLGGAFLHSWRRR